MLKFECFNHFDLSDIELAVPLVSEDMAQEYGVFRRVMTTRIPIITAYAESTRPGPHTDMIRQLWSWLRLKGRPYTRYPINRFDSTPVEIHTPLYSYMFIPS